jgi:RHS repeat-associated protein
LRNSGNTNLDTYDYAYNPGNQRTQEVFTAGNFMNYAYDNIGQLKTANGHEPGGTINRMQEQLGYFYDAAGNLNYRTNNTLLQAFNVNNLNELTTATNGGRLTVAGTTTSPATSVTVNTSNAILYVDTTFASTNQQWTSGNNTYTAIAQDSYGRKDTNVVTANLSGTNLFAYDLNGNMVTNGTRVLEYDDENQLIRITQPNTWKSEFSYDGKMRRRIRKEYAWNGSWLQTGEVHYVYDGNLVIQERDGNNFSQVTYTRGTDLSGSLQAAGGIGGLLARTANPSTLNPQLSTFATAFYHSDGNGNVTCLIYINQIIAAEYEYDPYGTILSQSGPLVNANLYRFASKEYHELAGLVYCSYRYYDPNSQRWLNRDLLGEDGGRNLFQFCGGDPENVIDPFGLEAVPTDNPPRRDEPREGAEACWINRSRNPLISQQLDRGCVGLCSVYQSCGGQYFTWPENAPNTTCFLTEAQAKAFKCPNNENPFLFAKQGHWNKMPQPGGDGSVPNNCINSLNFNYMTIKPGWEYPYLWMNHLKKNGYPQIVTISKLPCNDSEDPNTIWCVTCRKCK